MNEDRNSDKIFMGSSWVKDDARRGITASGEIVLSNIPDEFTYTNAKGQVCVRFYMNPRNNNINDRQPTHYMEVAPPKTT